MNTFKWFQAGLAAGLLWVGTDASHAGTYSQNFEALAPNATTFTDGSVLFGNQLGTTTKLLDALYKEIVLTRVGVGGTRAAFLLPDLDPGQRSWGFTARWVGQVYAQFSNPQFCADGFSFTAGQIGALDLAGAGYSQEDGFGTGLTLSARTFYGAGPGFYVFVNGVAVASAPYNLFNAWGDNNPAQRQFEVDWTQADGLTFRVDGLTVFDKVPTPGFIPQAGDRMAWGARTGDKNETVTLDNIVVHTALSPAPTLPLGSSGAAVVSGNSATLSGVVATDAAPVNAWFEWGPTTAYGNTTPVQSLAPSLLNSVVGATLGSLSGGTTFHFRLVAQDAVHTFHIFLGPDQSFFVPAFATVSLPGTPQGITGKVTWGDYDGDGDLDFLVVGQDHGSTSAATQLWRNDGAAGFTQVPLPGVGANYSGAVKWADFDHDGRLDFFITGDAGVTQLWHNDGADTFSSVPLPSPFSGRNPTYAEWGDFDGDGALDMILGDLFVPVALKRSLVLTPNLPPAAPAGLGTGVSTDGTVTFSWAAASDDHTPASGLSYNVRVGTSPGTCDILSPMAGADGKRRIVTMGNAQTRHSSRLVGLHPGTYYWSVQAIDGAYAGGAFATEHSFVIAPGNFSYESGTATVSENVGTYTVNILRSGGSENTVTVGYAIDSVIFGTLGGSVFFAAGETSKPLTIGIPNNNNLGPNPVVRFFLTFASTGGLQAPTRHTLTLTDDDVGVQANPDIGRRAPYRPLKFLLDDLLGNDFGTDELSAVMSITAVAATSAGGVSLHQEGGVVVYAPPDGFNSNDSFTYTLTADPRTALLGQFNGLDSAGTWTLFLADLSGGGRLQLDSWGVELRAFTPVPEPETVGCVAAVALLGFAAWRRPRR